MHARSPGAGRRDWISLATLAAIVVAVTAVSLPRLRSLALRENELDAAALIARLGERMGKTPSATLESLVGPGSALRRELEDAQWLEDSQQLRRHGYLFALQTGPGSAPVVLAWPWRHGQSGFAAFAWTSSSGVLGHPNRAGQFSGQSSPPALEWTNASDLPAAWVRLRPGSLR